MNRIRNIFKPRIRFNVRNTKTNFNDQDNFKIPLTQPYPIFPLVNQPIFPESSLIIQIPPALYNFLLSQQYVSAFLIKDIEKCIWNEGKEKIKDNLGKEWGEHRMIMYDKSFSHEKKGFI